MGVSERCDRVTLHIEVQPCLIAEMFRAQHGCIDPVALTDILRTKPDLFTFMRARKELGWQNGAVRRIRTSLC